MADEGKHEAHSEFHTQLPIDQRLEGKYLHKNSKENEQLTWPVLLQGKFSFLQDQNSYFFQLILVASVTDRLSTYFKF